MIGILLDVFGSMQFVKVFFQFKNPVFQGFDAFLDRIGQIDAVQCYAEYSHRPVGCGDSQ